MLVVAAMGAGGAFGGADHAAFAVLADPVATSSRSAAAGPEDRTFSGVDVSRNFDRREFKDRTSDQASQRTKALSEVNAKVRTRTNELLRAERKRRQWVLPVARYQLTAQFGQRSGLWSSGVHSGLDFAGPSGTEIVAIAKGMVVSAGYSGSYGFRTVIRLEDGTEVWYAHQSRITVNAGQQVQPGDLTGYTGATGNVTGPHLHLEVRPGGGDPVDPAAALKAHGLQV